MHGDTQWGSRCACKTHMHPCCKTYSMMQACSFTLTEHK